LQIGVDPAERQHRQFKQLHEFTLRRVMESEPVRTKFWAQADASSIDKWKQSTDFYRKYLWEEILGKLRRLPNRWQRRPARFMKK